MKIEVRRAEANGIHDFKRLVHAFYDEGVDRYGFGLNDEHLESAYFRWIEGHIGLFLLKDGEVIGGIAGLLIPYILNLDTFYFHEMFWYVDPEYRAKGWGIRLLTEAEREAKRRGAKLIMMVHAHSMPQEMDSIYRRLGYRICETNYIKEL